MLCFCVFYVLFNNYYISLFNLIFTTLYQYQFFSALEPGNTDMGVHILLAIQGLFMYAVLSYFHCSYI